MDKEIPVLLLDVDLRPIEGIIPAFGKSGIPMIAFSNKEYPLARHSKYVNRIVNTPSLDNESEYLHFLLDYSNKGVLVYSSDASAKFVSKYQDKLRTAGYFLNIADYKTFIRGFDKFELFKICKQIGVPVIDTILIEHEGELDEVYHKFHKPFILKGTRLAGGKYYVIDSKEKLYLSYKSLLDDVEEQLNVESGIIAQEFINYNYDEIFCSESYYDVVGKPAGFMGIKKFRPNIKKNGNPGSRMFAGTVIDDENLKSYTEKLLTHLNWKGFAHLDWLYSHKYKSYLLCEINPRLPGFSNLLVKSGFNTPLNYYYDLIGSNKNAINPKKNVLYFELFRIPGDFFSGLRAVTNGFISLKEFVSPYLKIITFKYKIYIDFVFWSDLKFSLAHWISSIKSLIK